MPEAAPRPADVLADLAAEGADLDALVTPLAGGRWQLATPATGWTIAHQIGHLAWTDEIALLAVTDPAAFGAAVRSAAVSSVDDAAAERAALPPEELLSGWRRGRAALHEALGAVPPGSRLPWFGPPMSAMSMMTARIMETWAHGQDVADALGVTRTPTDRLRHVAHIGVRTRDFAYAVNNRTPPGEAFRVELVSPWGELWAWGPEDAAQVVAGPALDFCLLVTQRRHRADLQLVAAGAQAEEWLPLAQAFAGAPGGGREPGQFS